jgi:uncharacterized protein (TIGR03435 family)
MSSVRIAILAVAAAGTAILLAGARTAPLAAQSQSTPSSTAAFEVASVKRAAPPSGGQMFVRLGGLQGNRWMAENVTLFMLIRNGYPQYQMQGQIIGGPAWLQSDRFNVTATVEGTPAAEQLRAMLQNLLANRFKLVAHTEMRELPVLALVLARSDGKLGPKMRPAGVDCEKFRADQQQQARQGGSPAVPPAPPKPGEAAPPCSTMMTAGPGTMRAESGGMTTAQLATLLSQTAGRPVVDRTGLKGDYAVSVEFAREPGSAPLFGGAPPIAPPEAQAKDAAAAAEMPSIFSAVQEQLGLKLDSRRESVEVLVIDRAEPPSED